MKFQFQMKFTFVSFRLTSILIDTEAQIKNTMTKDVKEVYY